MQNSRYLTVQEAQKILAAFNYLTAKSIASASEKAQVREALLLLARLSDYQILGVLADTAAQGLVALETYLAALGYQALLNPSPVEGPVYIKFNPKTGLCYINSCRSQHRGVLVSYQSAQEGAINETYGHLPLDLFQT
jgi:hypothetical protein